MHLTTKNVTEMDDTSHQVTNSFYSS